MKNQFRHFAQRRWRMLVLLLCGITLFVVWWQGEASRTHMWRVPYGVVDLTFSPDGSMLASADVPSDRLLSGERAEPGSIPLPIQIRRVQDGRVVHTLAGHTGRVGYVTFSPDGQYIAATTSANQLMIWQVATEQLVTTLQLQGSRWYNKPLFSPDGLLLALCTGTEIVVWETNTWQIRRRLIPAVGLAGWTADSTAVIGRESEDGEVVAWQIEDGAVRSISPPPHTWLIAASPDGRWLATKNDARGAVIDIWDTNTGQLVVTLPIYEDIQKLAWSPDSQHLAVGSGTVRHPIMGKPRQGNIRIWSVPDGQLRQTISKAHRVSIFALSYSPDGRWVVSGGYDGHIGWWRMPE